MSRALRLLAQHAFTDLGLERLHLHTVPENVASARAAESAGFKREALMRKGMLFRDRRRDVLIYSLLPTDQHP